MNTNTYINQKTEEAQFTFEGTGLYMPKPSTDYTVRVVDTGVTSIKSNLITTHNAKVEDLGDKIMRGVPLPLANGNVLKLDLTYDQVLIANPEFAQKRLDDKRKRGQGMVDAANAETDFFGIK
tara:strand:- start:622 stop:990 length:369 start_codon:yes stop_codon:yes gene_type:complete